MSTPFANPEIGFAYKLIAFMQLKLFVDFNPDCFASWFIMKLCVPLMPTNAHCFPIQFYVHKHQ